MLSEAAGRMQRSQFFTILTNPKLVHTVTYLFFSKLSNEKKNLTEKNSRKRFCDRGQR